MLTTRLFISKEEVGQMNNHIGWFEENYGADATVKYVHVHPTNIISSKANYNKEIFVLTPKVLEVLKTNLKNFIKEFASYNPKTIEENYICEALVKNHLTLNDLETKYAIRTIKET